MALWPSGFSDGRRKNRLLQGRRDGGAGIFSAIINHKGFVTFRRDNRTRELCHRCTRARTRAPTYTYIFAYIKGSGDGGKGWGYGGEQCARRVVYKYGCGRKSGGSGGERSFINARVVGEDFTGRDHARAYVHRDRVRYLYLYIYINSLPPSLWPAIAQSIPSRVPLFSRLRRHTHTCTHVHTRAYTVQWSSGWGKIHFYVRYIRVHPLCAAASSDHPGNYTGAGRRDRSLSDGPRRWTDERRADAFPLRHYPIVYNAIHNNSNNDNNNNNSHVRAFFYSDDFRVRPCSFFRYFLFVLFRPGPGKIGTAVITGSLCMYIGTRTNLERRWGYYTFRKRTTNAQHIIMSVAEKQSHI